MGPPAIRVPRWARRAPRPVLTAQGSDRIELSILLPRPPQAVWTMLTDPAQVGAWLGGGNPAVLQLQPGGRVEISRSDRRWITGRVMHAQPPTFLHLRREHPSPFGSVTHVYIHLEDHLQGTSMQLVETGTPAAEHHNPGATRERALDWTRALQQLAEHAAGRRTSPSRQITWPRLRPSPAADPAHDAPRRSHSKATP